MHTTSYVLSNELQRQISGATSLTDHTDHALPEELSALHTSYDNTRGRVSTCAAIMRAEPRCGHPYVPSRVLALTAVCLTRMCSS